MTTNRPRETKSSVHGKALAGSPSRFLAGKRSNWPAVLAVMLATTAVLPTKLGKAQSADNGEITREEADRLVELTDPAILSFFDVEDRGRRFANRRRACEIAVMTPGTIAPNIEGTTLSSKSFSGRAGTALVYAGSRRYRLSIDTPRGFSVFPVGGANPVIMTASFLGYGDTNFSERGTSARVRLRRGITAVETHLVAERSDGSSFPAGSYAAEVTLRCE